nr:unnamed protein product [Callosobruchus analis]
MKADSSMKEDFRLLALEQFWVKRLPLNSNHARLALRVLIPFFNLLKTKQRNRLDVDSDLIIALTKTVPRINQHVLNMQFQASH